MSIIDFSFQKTCQIKASSYCESLQSILRTSVDSYKKLREAVEMVKKTAEVKSVNKPTAMALQSQNLAAKNLANSPSMFYKELVWLNVKVLGKSKGQTT